jgi:hypothetical protein
MTYALLYKSSKMKIVLLTIVKKPSWNYLITQFTVAHSPTIGLELLAVNRMEAAVLYLCSDYQLAKDIAEF